jgi:hypothetical protein
MGFTRVELYVDRAHGVRGRSVEPMAAQLGAKSLLDYEETWTSLVAVAQILPCDAVQPFDLLHILGVAACPIEKDVAVGSRQQISVRRSPIPEGVLCGRLPQIFIELLHRFTSGIGLGASSQ